MPLRFARVALGLICLLLVAAGAVQAQNDDPILTYFDGGVMNIGFDLGSQLAGGPGISSLAVGGAAPAVSDPNTVFRNPAGLRFIGRDPAFALTLHPQLSIEFSQIPFDIESGLNDAVDSFAEGFQTTDDFTYPELTGTLARTASSLSSFSFAVPMRGGWVGGLGYSRPFHLGLNVIHSGFRQRIDTVEDDPNQQVAFAIQTRINSRLDITADTWTFALAKDLGKYFTVGASTTTSDMKFETRGGYNINGIMTQGGQQYAFNNEADPWYNKLHSVVNGTYEGRWWTTRLGFTVSGQQTESWRFGLDAQFQGDVSLDGALDLLIDEFPALVLEPAEGEDPFDVNRIADVTEITRTYPNEYRPGNSMIIHLPSRITATVAKGGGLKPSLTGVYYTQGKFGYDLEMAEKAVADTAYTSRSYGRGLVLNYSVYLGINPGWFIFGVGATWAEDYVNGYVDGDGNPEEGGNALIIPRLDLGISIRLSSNLRYELLIAGLPEDVLRMGISYDF